MAIGDRAPLLPAELTRSIRQEILDIVGAAHLSHTAEHAVVSALSGPTRVLPEGKPSLRASLTFLSYSSAAGGPPDQVVPAVAAMEMLLATGDLIDDIQDDEADLPRDRRSLGQLLETVALLLMLCHSAVSRLAERGVPPSRVLRTLGCIDALGVAAMRGQAHDMDLEERQGVAIEDALSASAMKSASLTRCASELGGSLGTDDPAEIDLYGRFGWHLGLTTQLTNDVAAVWPGGREKSDLRLRKKTVPIVFALSLPLNSSPHAQVVRSYYEGEGTSPASEEKAKLALWRCGAVHYTWIIAAREKARAQQIVRTLAAGSSGDGPLAQLLN